MIGSISKQLTAARPNLTIRSGGGRSDSAYATKNLHASRVIFFYSFLLTKLAWYDSGIKKSAQFVRIFD